MSGKVVLSQYGRRQVDHIWSHVQPGVRTLKMYHIRLALTRPDLAARARRDFMNWFPTRGEYIQHPERCPGRSS
jgi:hypothetical protein